jgi:hypothetical protein
MNRCYSQLLTVLVLLVFTGCTNDPKEEVLTAEIAKRTLLEMDMAQIFPDTMVPEPKDEPIKFLDADTIAVGSWTCNLMKKTFSIQMHYPEPRNRPVVFHAHNEVSGVFQRTWHGKWVAKVTFNSHTL